MTSTTATHPESRANQPVLDPHQDGPCQPTLGLLATMAQNAFRARQGAMCLTERLNNNNPTGKGESHRACLVKRTASDSAMLCENSTIPIDLELIDILRRITPTFLGGTAETEDWAVLPTPSLLTRMYDRIFSLGRELDVACWETPRSHKTFNQDGGWGTYILKVHQIALACLMYPKPLSYDNMDEEAWTSLQDQHLQFVNGRGQHNLFEATLLWNAAREAKKATQKNSEEDDAQQNNTNAAEQRNADVETKDVGECPEKRLRQALCGEMATGDNSVMSQQSTRASAYRELPWQWHHNYEGSVSLRSLSTTRCAEDTALTSLNSGVLGTQSIAGETLSEDVSRSPQGVEESPVLQDISGNWQSASSPSDFLGPEGSKFPTGSQSAPDGDTSGASTRHQEQKKFDSGWLDTDTQCSLQTFTGEEQTIASSHLFAAATVGSETTATDWLQTTPIRMDQGIAIRLVHHNYLRYAAVPSIVIDSYRQCPCIVLPFEALTLAIRSHGRFDPYLWSLFFSRIENKWPTTGFWASRLPPFFHGAPERIFALIKRLAAEAHRVLDVFTAGAAWDRQEWDAFLAKVDQPSKTETPVEVLHGLEKDIHDATLCGKDLECFRWIEFLLVAFLGHTEEAVRNRATILLNTHYDTHSWQNRVPLPPVIRSVGDPFTVVIELPSTAVPGAQNSPPEDVVLVLVAPGFEPTAPLDVCSYHPFRWTRKISAGGNSSLPQKDIAAQAWVGVVSFLPFPRCGYYDWRVARLDDVGTGLWKPVEVPLTAFKRCLYIAAAHGRPSHTLDLLICGATTSCDDATHSEGCEPFLSAVHPDTVRSAEEVCELFRLAATIMQDEPGTEHQKLDTVDTSLLLVPLQGRFIVHPANFAQEQIHEIVVDCDAKIDEKFPDRLQPRRSFSSIEKSLGSLRESGFTSLCLSGGLACATAPQTVEKTHRSEEVKQKRALLTSSVTCRSTPNPLGGRPDALKGLSAEAQRLGLRLVMNIPTRISSIGMHRKYSPHVLHYIDQNGHRTPLLHSASDGHFSNALCHLNYRNLDCWTSFISDLFVLADVYGVTGFRIKDAAAFPLFYSMNVEELHRCDADGNQHYTHLDRLHGVVVNPASAPYSPAFVTSMSTMATAAWPNPFLVYVCRTLWRFHPDILLLGDCNYSVNIPPISFPCEKHPYATVPGAGGQASLARSGVVPCNQSLCVALGRFFGMHFDLAAGSLASVPKGSPVKNFFSWQTDAYKGLPEGSTMVQTTAPGSLPLPGLLYKRGAWPAADALFFLPGIPLTSAEEEAGHAYRLVATHGAVGSAADDPSLETAERPSVTIRDMYTYRPAQGLDTLEQLHRQSVGPEFGFDLQRIGYHYAHRRRLRQYLRLLESPTLRSNLFIPLIASERGGSFCSDVLAFLRLDPIASEFIIICMNFSEETFTSVTVCLDFLLQYFYAIGLPGRTPFVAMDLLGPSVTDILNKEALKYLSMNKRTSSMPDRLFLKNVIRFPDPNADVYTLAELTADSFAVTLGPYQTACVGFRPLSLTEKNNSQVTPLLYASALNRLRSMTRSCVTHAIVRGDRVPSRLDRAVKQNVIVSSLVQSIWDKGIASFAAALNQLQELLANAAPAASNTTHCATLEDQEEDEEQIQRRAFELHTLLISSCLFADFHANTFDPALWRPYCTPDGGGTRAFLTRVNPAAHLAERLLAKLQVLVDSPLVDTSAVLSVSSESKHPTHQMSMAIVKKTRLQRLAQHCMEASRLGPIVFVTSELGKWSTVGGLGVMVDELTQTLAGPLEQTVYVISPYYHNDRKDQRNVLDPSEVQYIRNIRVYVTGEEVVLGVHEGLVNNVHLIFLHNERFFPCPYPSWSNAAQALRQITVFCKASLEILCQKRLIPQLIVTNDWPTGLASAYAKSYHAFGNVFEATTFYHIAHNLNYNYEGRIYPDGGQDGGLAGWITELPTDLLVDPTWSQTLYNPSRCALLTCDAWGTVSPSFRDNLRSGSPLAPLLNRHTAPFAYPNGVLLPKRLNQMSTLPYKDHESAKAAVQKRYFDLDVSDPSIPLFAFIGRVTEQKGVHFILDAAEQLIPRYQGKIHILVGGKVRWDEPYAAYCGHKMEFLRRQHYHSFWANPNEFFSDGPLINLAADVGLMPSKFEPGGIVQHEFFLAGTPVLAFRTGGLKDTVYEFNPELRTGNGFTFEAYQLGDFLYAMERACCIIRNFDHYERLRQNARYSVISCEQVARAWLGEFCRLRQKIPVNSARVSRLVQHFKHEEREALTRYNATTASFFPRNPVTASGNPHTLLRQRQLSASFPRAGLKLCLSGSIPSSSGHTNDASADTNAVKPTQGDSHLSGPTVTGVDCQSNSSSPATPTASATTATAQNRKARSVLTRITYTPRTSRRPDRIAVIGSFDQWEVRWPMKWDGKRKEFSAVLSLLPGRYSYKLVVDGYWALNPGALTERDTSQGVINNIVFAVAE